MGSTRLRFAAGFTAAVLGAALFVFGCTSMLLAFVKEFEAASHPVANSSPYGYPPNALAGDAMLYTSWLALAGFVVLGVGVFTLAFVRGDRLTRAVPTA